MGARPKVRAPPPPDSIPLPIWMHDGTAKEVQKPSPQQLLWAGLGFQHSPPTSTSPEDLDDFHHTLEEDRKTPVYYGTDPVVEYYRTLEANRPAHNTSPEPPGTPEFNEQLRKAISAFASLKTSSSNSPPTKDAGCSAHPWTQDAACNTHPSAALNGGVPWFCSCHNFTLPALPGVPPTKSWPRAQHDRDKAIGTLRTATPSRADQDLRSPGFHFFAEQYDTANYRLFSQLGRTYSTPPLPVHFNVVWDQDDMLPSLLCHHMGRSRSVDTGTHIASLVGDNWSGCDLCFPL